MKVLFSNPPWWENDRAGVRAGSRWPHTNPATCPPDKFRFGGYLPVPFFMTYAASYARKHLGCEVLVRDSIALRESYKSFYKAISEIRPDWLVIETATPSWHHDSFIIRQIKHILPHVKIILTGTISEVDPETLMEGNRIHAIVKGEYEKGVVAVINGQTGLVPHMMLSLEEMNAAPFPDYPADCWDHYWDSNPKGQIAPSAQVWTSRGCVFKCIFCVWPAVMTGNDPDGKGKRIVRGYTPEYMEAWLGELTARHPFKTIYLDDDTFNLGNAHTLKMCAVMRKIGKPWSAMCRADTIKRETWKEMKDSGCFGVKVGFESGNQWVVDNIVNKHLNLAEAADTVRYLKSIGMTVHGTFTVGLPGETKEQAQETIAFIGSLPLDSHQLSGTAEIEGTPLANLRQKGHLDAYSGAESDKRYVIDPDGGRKAQTMIEQLRA